MSAMPRYPSIPTGGPTPSNSMPGPSSAPGATHHSSSSTTSSTSMPWTVPGALGGVLLGATVAGPFGAAAGGLVGALAGAFRDLTGRSVAQAFLEASEEEQRRIMQQAGFLLMGASAPKPGADGAAGSSGSGGAAPGLSVDELAALESCPAGVGEPVCVLCMSNAVQVVFQPCGHAQVCSQCAAQLLRMGFTGACPTCRARIHHISRIYVASSASAPASASAPEAQSCGEAAGAHASSRRASAPPIPPPAPKAPRAPSAPPMPTGQ